jgi:UDP-N-acetylmuramyl-tripeptide synthetase
MTASQHHLSDIFVLLANQKSAPRLTSDTRQVRSGDIVFAYPGARFDPRTQIKSLLDQGVCAVLYEAKNSANLLSSQALTPADQARIFPVQDLKQHAGTYARAILVQHNQSQAAQNTFPQVVAVTGTNGKTTISTWISQALSALGQACASVGTVGIVFEPKNKTQQFHTSTGGLTTPDAISWQQTCFDLGQAGAQWIAVEASSIGLCEHRLTGTLIHTAIFTNLTRDHLDYHGTFEAYAQAKAQLFQWPDLQVAIINHDDPIGRIWLESLESDQPVIRAKRVISYGLSPAPNIKHIRSIRFTQIEQISSGYRVELEFANQRTWLNLNFFGHYQLSNALALIATLLGQETELFRFEPSMLQHVFSNIRSVVGRLEQINTAQQMHQPLVLVDYAHTPDALEKALGATRELSTHRAGKLWVVFGCGGNRDKGKRPLMAQVAVKLADYVVLTSDNPRFEDPNDILKDMQVGLNEINHIANVQVCVDRKEAIETAVKHAQPNDVILIAGKGHEDYQEIAGIKHPFSDQLVAKQALEQL